MVSALNYLCSLTCSVRPDEVAPVWRLQKLALNNIYNSFVSAQRSLLIMDTNKVSNLFS